MVRPGVVIACVVAATVGHAHAADLPRAPGLYPAAGPALAMVDSKVEVTVRGPIVEVVVTQRFRNATEHPAEATYIFPLPVDAAVSAMSIKYGPRTVRAAIERREDAQRRYEAAVRAGVVAAVLDQERPDVFTQTVAAIPAKATVEVTLRYDTVARYHGGTWELVLPMVVAPRYVPGAATARPTTGTGRSPDTDRAPDASRVTPGGAPGAGGSTEVAIRFVDQVIELTSPTHELRGPSADRPREVAFTDPTSDHDAVVRWRSTAPAGGWVEQDPDGGYAAVVVEAAAPGPRKGPLRCLIVLDRSAASRGDAEAVAHPFVRALFGALGPADRVAVIGSDQIAWSLPGDAARGVEQAWPAAAGAFDLTRVLAAARPDGAPIVVVSGGLVADDRAAIAAAKRLGVPVHLIGVGPAPARGLLTELAGATGGTARFLVPGDDVTAHARAVVADAASRSAPLAVSWGTLAASEVVPGTLPRLGAGQAMVVLARVTRAQTANARARGELFAIEVTSPPRIVDGATTALGPLARRWARGRLDELVRSATPAAITAHAVRYGLVSPYTSLVAIGDEIVVRGGVKRSVAVPVSVPAGMRWHDVKEETTVDTSSVADQPPIVLQAPIRAAPTVPGDHKPTKRGEADRPAKPRPNRRAPEPPSPSAAADAGGAEAGDEAVDRDRELEAGTLAGPAIVVAGESVVATSASRSSRGVRISAGVGVGLATAGGRRGSLVALSTRLELGNRTMFGIGGALWLVDTDDVQGNAMVTIARRGLRSRRLELGLGLGLQLGHGAGPAGALSLRYHLPPAPRAAGYLRYDGALLIDDATRRGQNAVTLGLEYGF